MKKFSEFDPASYLNSEETRREYLNEVFASGDEGEIKRALFLVIKSLGIVKIADKSGLSREGIYKMFRPNSKPRFESVFKVIKALNLRLGV